MSDDRTARINAAVDELLDRCLRGRKTPLAMLGDCIDELQEDGTWSEPDIETVRTAVLRILAQHAQKGGSGMAD